MPGVKTLGSSWLLDPVYLIQVFPIKSHQKYPKVSKSTPHQVPPVFQPQKKLSQPTAPAGWLITILHQGQFHNPETREGKILAAT